MSELDFNVIGIDPSLTATGVAAWRSAHAVGYGRGESGDRRLVVIADYVRSQLDTWRANLVLLEDLPTHAHSAGLTGMVQGVIRRELLVHKADYVTVPPASLKKYATGKGNATKADMRMAWFKRAGDDERDDNIVDALWLRQMGLDAIGHRDAMEMPKAQREVLLKLTWPKDVAARLLAPYEVVQREVTS